MSSAGSKTVSDCRSKSALRRTPFSDWVMVLRNKVNVFHKHVFHKSCVKVELS